MNTQDFLTMLTYRRAHGSDGERAFVDRYVMPRDPRIVHDPRTGEELAYVLVTDPESRVMFSSHVDTMHPAGRGPVFQPVVHDENIGLAYLPKGAGGCLGADDGAGVYLLLSMYEAGVPGTYVFHRGEERGGIGSGGIAKHHSEFLRHFDYAIAFDRRGTTDVITHQFVGRCCSTLFAQGFADLLDMDYSPCSGGSFTDTANYIDDIAECTNVSCGYEGEHGPGECVDVYHVERLRERLLEVGHQIGLLPIERKAGERDPDDFDLGTYGWFKSDFAPRVTKDDADWLASELFNVLADMGMRTAYDALDYDTVVAYAEEYPEEMGDMLWSLENDPHYWDDVEVMRWVGKATVISGNEGYAA